MARLVNQPKKDLGRIPTVEEIEQVIILHAKESDLFGGERRVLAEKVLTLITDDPSQDLVGTVRQSSGGIVVVKMNKRHPETSNRPYLWTEIDRDGELVGFGPETVRGWKKIGTVPGTPAWHAEQAEKKDADKIRELLFRLGEWVASDLLKMQPGKVIKYDGPVVKRDAELPGILFVWQEYMGDDGEKVHYEVRLGQLEQPKVIHSRGY